MVAEFIYGPCFLQKHLLYIVGVVNDFWEMHLNRGDRGKRFFFNVRLSIFDVPGYIKGKIGSRWEYTGICDGKIPQGLGH